MVITKGAPREGTCSAPSTSQGHPGAEDPGAADVLLDMKASDFESEEEIPATVQDPKHTACKVPPTANWK